MDSDVYLGPSSLVWEKTSADSWNMVFTSWIYLLPPQSTKGNTKNYPVAWPHPFLIHNWKGCCCLYPDCLMPVIVWFWLSCTNLEGVLCMYAGFTVDCFQTSWFFDLIASQLETDNDQWRFDSVCLVYKACLSDRWLETVPVPCTWRANSKMNMLTVTADYCNTVILEPFI